MSERVFIALGSNIGQRLDYLQMGLNELHGLSGLEILSASSVYETAPLGTIEQPPFLNAVCCARAEGSPVDLLKAMQTIEHRHGRQRTVHWGPRTLDLDLLLFGDACIDSPLLTLPHPHIAARDFVLVPLLQIAPDACDPTSAVPYAHHLKQLRAAELPAVAELTLPMTQHHARAH